jgi:hypothetical protein
MEKKKKYYCVCQKTNTECQVVQPVASLLSTELSRFLRSTTLFDQKYLNIPLY